MADTQQRPGISLGSVAGTPVVLRRTWFVIAAVLTFVLGPQVQGFVPGIGTAAAYAVALAFSALLLGSVFLHEVAHAVTAQAVGTPPTEIVLDLWGGHTGFSHEVPTPGRSILVAIVGPVTNGLIAVGALLAYRWTTQGSIANVLLLLVWTTNGFVAVLNALPGLPLDGGRVLEGVVWAVTRSRTAGTLVAGWAGRLVALVVVFWLLVRPLVAGTPPGFVSVIWVLVVASMLWQGAGQAIRYAAWRRVAAFVSAGRLMTPAVTVSSSASVADARAAAVAARGGPAVVVVLDVYGRPAGVVDEAAFSSVPPERAGLVPVSAVARTLPQVLLSPEESGDDLVGRLQASPAGEYPVVDDGRVVGVLTWARVAATVAGR